ncbi:hypothetical protein F3Y22_tig00110443pilonHSYRG00204 [Hibiscus syriacus]|uniref:DNA (Cytosine-5)-methyltransferase DRM1/2 n=1 Tax=Hibiscus syriacus TaxID=106335 RepID=A0A6A3AKY8_HIBSY|nr:hypothetical protein F3Y22_tig00110443pilonHSYRG00204 [Hibiscus syriacus]
MQHVDFDNNSSDYEAIFQDDFTNIDSFSDTKGILNSDSDEENKLLYLIKIGYSEVEALIAMERCGPDSSIAELKDFICDAQMAKAAETLLPVEDRKPLCNDPNYEKRQNSSYDLKCQIDRKIRKALEAYDDESPSSVQKYVLDECQKWNLVWVGRNKVVPLKPDEVEMLLSFNVLSLFSGISDTEIPLPYSTFPESWKGLVDGKTGYLNFWNPVTNVHPYERLVSVESVSMSYSVPYVLNFKFNNLLKDIMDIILSRKLISMEEAAMMYQDLS